MNYIQSQPLSINSEVLYYIKSNFFTLIQEGLLMPVHLASLNVAQATNLLREKYMEEESVRKLYPYSAILDRFLLRVQRARNEVFLLSIAEAYDGFHFYIPSILDWSGRITQSGVFNFHGGDLIRSLIVFPNNKIHSPSLEKSLIQYICVAAAYHYDEFDSYMGAFGWYEDTLNKKSGTDDGFMELAKEAKEPFQLISKLLILRNTRVIYPFQLPITLRQDEFHFAYISYLLLDIELAHKSNLIPCEYIQDIVSYFIPNNLIESYIDSFLSCINMKNGCFAGRRVASSILNIIKKFIITYVFCDTKMIENSSLVDEWFKQQFGYHLGVKITNDIIQYIKPHLIKDRVDKIRNFINLINTVTWFSSKMVTKSFTKKKEILFLFDSKNKKKWKVQIKIPNTKTDTNAKFDNFLIDKSTQMAIKMNHDLINQGSLPVYTVNDTFITNTENALKLPNLYTDMILSDTDPLSIINSFILKNLALNKDYSSWGGQLDNPIREQILIDFFNKLISGKSLSDKALHYWIQKGTSLMKLYSIYIQKVCGEANQNRRYYCYQFYKNKLSLYKQEVKYGINSCLFNYSLHL